MSRGIARKLKTTYFIIVLASVVSGICCLYVLSVNLHSNTEMRRVTLPSLDHLKEMRIAMQNVKKLTNSWVYIAGNRDRGRLEHIVNAEYPRLQTSLVANVSGWQDPSELQSFALISSHNTHVIDSARKIMALLSKPEFYTNDPVVDYAILLNTYVDSIVRENDRRFGRLIDTKEQNLITQQHRVNYLLHSLYIVILLTILIVVAVSIIASRYSSRKIVKPILSLDQTMLEMAIGKVVPVKEVKRNDEIGQMQTAVNKMIDGILSKIDFAEQIGKGNYDADFKLLSPEDKFGIALQNMRDDLRRSTQVLMEQDRRLIDAQKLARIGNYFYDFESGEVQTSSTLDDIMGIGRNFPKRIVSWKDHIHPRFHPAITRSAIAAIKGHKKFVESYIIKRYSDGKESWVTAIGEYNYDDNGRAVSMFGTIQDVTESKLLEIELNNAYNISREQNNRLLNFSYIVSHNLRMHAVNIHGLLGMLSDAATDEERTLYTNYLFTASEKLDETLHHLNEVVAMQHTLDTKKTPVALSSAIAGALGALKTQIDEKQARVINNIPVGIMVNYNPVYLDSILLNLLSNAIKYSAPVRQPIVTLSCYKHTDDQALTYWVLEVADNGRGIDLDLNGDKLFGMYKTFHGNKDARGVGLFMTKYQAEAMGGRITAESKVDEGSIFRVFIKQ